MDVGRALLAVDAGPQESSFDQFRAALDPHWIEAALAATRAATVRRRKLPAGMMVWIEIGMALFRDRSIQ